MGQLVRRLRECRQLPQEHGWNTGSRAREAAVDAAKAAELDGRKLALEETVDSLKAKGVSFDSSIPRMPPPC